MDRHSAMPSSCRTGGARVVGTNNDADAGWCSSQRVGGKSHTRRSPPSPTSPGNATAAADALHTITLGGTTSSPDGCATPSNAPSSMTATPDAAVTRAGSRDGAGLNGARGRRHRGDAPDDAVDAVDATEYDRRDGVESCVAREPDMDRGCTRGRDADDNDRGGRDDFGMSMRASAFVAADWDRALRMTGGLNGSATAATAARSGPDADNDRERALARGSWPAVGGRSPSPSRSSVGSGNDDSTLTANADSDTPRDAERSRATSTSERRDGDCRAVGVASAPAPAPDADPVSLSLSLSLSVNVASARGGGGGGCAGGSGGGVGCAAAAAPNGGVDGGTAAAAAAAAGGGGGGGGGGNTGVNCNVLSSDDDGPDCELRLNKLRNMDFKPLLRGCWDGDGDGDDSRPSWLAPRPLCGAHSGEGIIANGAASAME